MENKIKICAISDTHGLLPEIKEEIDLLFICGDISPLKIQSQDSKIKKWLETRFLFWIKSIKVDKVILIGGNHDFFFQHCSKNYIKELELLSDNKLKYLHNEYYEYLDRFGKIWSIFGTPYCKIFGNWPFMLDYQTLEEKFKQIPEKVNIILSHDAPLGISDICLANSYFEGLGHLGNSSLRNRLDEIEFNYLFHGHLHSSDHKAQQLNLGLVYNVSLLDENYEFRYSPLYLEI